MGMRIGEGGGVAGLPAGMPQVTQGIVLKMYPEYNGLIPNLNDVKHEAVFGPLIAGNRDVFGVRAVDPNKVIIYLPNRNAYCYNGETGEAFYTGDLGQRLIHPPTSIKGVAHQNVWFGDGIVSLEPKNDVQRATKEAALKALDYHALVRRNIVIPALLKLMLEGVDPKKKHVTTQIRFSAAHSLDWSTQADPDTALMIRSMYGHLFYYRHPDKHMGVYIDNGHATGVASRDQFILGEVHEVEKALGWLEPENDMQYETLVGFMDRIKNEPRGFFH